MQGSFGSDRLRKSLARVRLRKERLALEIGGFDKVAIENTETSNAGANEQIGSGRADSSAADEDRAGGA